MDPSNIEYDLLHFGKFLTALKFTKLDVPDILTLVKGELHIDIFISTINGNRLIDQDEEDLSVLSE